MALLGSLSDLRCGNRLSQLDGDADSDDSDDYVELDEYDDDIDLEPVITPLPSPSPQVARKTLSMGVEQDAAKVSCSELFSFVPWVKGVYVP